MGGLSGIGAAIARALAEAKYRVTAAGLPGSEAEHVPAIETRHTDITDPAAVARLVTPFEQLDLLVNCAGILRRGGSEFDPDEFHRVLGVNLTGTMRMCQACHGPLKAAGGAIVNTASMLSFFGSGTVPAYSASKGGIAQLTR